MALSKTKPAGLPLVALLALVVSSMIGGGIFSMPQNMAASAGAGAIIIGWVISAVGMLMLAFAFQILATRRADVSGSVYGYARAGFGNLIGFNSAWGYWLSALIGNVGYLVVLFASLGNLIPAANFGSGNTVPALIGATVVLWLVHFLVLKGVKTAALVNSIVLVAKMVPLLIFVVAVAVVFKARTFRLDFWGDPTLGSVMQQIKGCMLVTVWVFIGIEGASVYSTRARKAVDVGRATVLGFVITLVMLMLVSLLSMGVLTREQLAGLKNPSMTGVIEAALGGAKWGGIVVNLGLIVCVTGAILAWIMLAAELPYLAAKDGVFPRALSKENKHGAPVSGLWLTNIVTEGFLILSFVAVNAYYTMITLASAMILFPYLLSGLFLLKVALQGGSPYKDLKKGVRSREICLGVLATIYGIWLLVASGWQSIIVTFILYGVGLIFFAWAHREARRAGAGSPIKWYEWIIGVIIVAFFVIGIVFMSTGIVKFG